MLNCGQFYFWPSNFCWKISRSRLKNSMADSKLYGFPLPSKMIYIDDGVAAVGYKSSSTPPLLILNRRRPLVLKYRCIGKWMWNITLLSSDSTKFDCFVNHRCKWINRLFIYSFMKVWVCITMPEFKSFWKLGEKLFVLYI